MEVVHPHCAGLDVHKDSVVACVRHMVHGAVTTDVRTFKTTTQELMALSDWLSAAGCTHAAMEATGVYWKPVWHILCDGELQLVLANAAHVKNVPGRKTDVNDATWLADLMAHGLIRASFVPDEPTQQMRDLLRTRKQFVRERSSHTQRLQKTLEDANIKLDSVLTNILGLSSRRILEALIAGQTAPQALAKLAHNNIKATSAELEASLHGRVTAPPLYVAAASGPSEGGGCGHCLHRSGGRRQRRTLSCRHQNAEHHPRYQQPLGRSDRGRDWDRHEPFPQRRPPDLLGRTLSQKRRKRRKAPFQPHQKRTSLAEDHPRAMRLGGLAHQAKLPPGSIPPPPLSAWGQEGHLRRRRFHPHRRLPHAQKRNPLPGSRRKLLRPARQRQASTPSRQSSPEPRIRRSNQPRNAIVDLWFLIRIARSTQLPAWGIRASSDSESDNERAPPVVVFLPATVLRGRVIASRELRGL